MTVKPAYPSEEDSDLISERLLNGRRLPEDEDSRSPRSSGGPPGSYEMRDSGRLFGKPYLTELWKSCPSLGSGSEI
jgi:hypothetical protein